MELQMRKLYDVTAPNRSTGIINGKCSNVVNWDDCRFEWAYPMYKRMLGNFWTPFEINLASDKRQFAGDPTIKGALNEYEKDTFKKIFGLLAFLDSIQTDYSYKVANYITDPSLNALFIILAQQEIVHNHSYSYVLSSVATKAEQDEVFEYWKHDPVLRERNDFLAQYYEAFTTNPTPETLIRSIVLDIVLEGLNFYSAFAFFYNLARNQKMVGSSTMINYINRDEEQHVNLFTHVFREILKENPYLDTPELEKFVYDTFTKAAELEIKWSHYIIGNRFDGLNVKDLERYIKFMAGKRTMQLGYQRIFPEYRDNPLRWIKHYEEVDLGKTDIFEQRSRQYTKVSEDNDFDDL